MNSERRVRCWALGTQRVQRGPQGKGHGPDRHERDTGFPLGQAEGRRS